MDEQKNEGKNKTTLYCSFCGKSQHEVKKLIAGPTVFICDECVELCMDIIKEEHQSSITKNKEGIPSLFLVIEDWCSSLRISIHSSTHSSQMNTVGPAINFLTSC